MPAGMHDGMVSSQQQSADDNRGHQTSSGPFSKETKQALRDQREQAVLSISPSTSNVNKAIRYGLNTLVFPGSGKLYSNAIDKNAMGYGNYKSKNTKQKQRQKYEELKLLEEMNNNDNNSTMIPYSYDVQQPKEEVAEPYNQFTYDEDVFGLGGDSANVTRASYDFNQGGRAGKAEGGIMELRARRAFGGIMDRVTGRKAYGLGSIFKSVKKAASKVLSSDIGKAAIIGAGIYYGGGGRMPFTKAFAKDGFGGFKAFGEGSFFSKSNPLLFSAKDGEQKFNPFKFTGLTTLIGAGMGPAKQDPSLMATRSDTQLIDPITGQPAKPAEMRASLNNALDNADGDPIRIKQINDAYAFLGPDERLGTYSPYRTYGVKDGGRIGKAEGGLMDLGGMEKDYRAEGGFVPIGEYEKKDDVPARLSVNEFVFTADAVRGAGQGDIDKGAEIMENMMKNLEKGGTISEESQGNIGAQQMFETSERLGEVI